jgi:hypothetical protein
MHRPGDPTLVSAAAKLTGSAPSLTFDVKVPAGGAGADLFVESPDDIYLPMPKKIGEPAPGTIRFAIDLSSGVEIGGRGELDGPVARRGMLPRSACDRLPVGDRELEGGSRTDALGGAGYGVFAWYNCRKISALAQSTSLRSASSAGA